MGGRLTVSGVLEAGNGARLQVSDLRSGVHVTGPSTQGPITDLTSSLEIGNSGGAASGTITIDSGYTLTASGTESFIAPTILDNGIMVAAAGTLSLSSSSGGLFPGDISVQGGGRGLTGSGQVQIGEGAGAHPRPD